MEKRNIPEITVLRALCAVGIVVYHFLGASRSGIEFLHNFTNGTWGNVYVTVFFVISGAVLYNKYPKMSSVKRFYLRRAVSIYPAFYIAYIFFFIQRTLFTGDLLPHNNYWSIIFTFLGIDGYEAYHWPTYYLVGEWFIGAIIVQYLLYPLYCRLINSSWIAFSVLILVLYAMRISNNSMPRCAFQSVPACTLTFGIGMLIMKFQNNLLKNETYIVSGVLALILLFIPIKCVNQYVVNQFFGVCFFFSFFGLGKVFMKNAFLYRLFNEIGALSYCIFLVQHQIIDYLTGYQNPSSIGGTIIMLLCTLILTYVMAKILKLVVDSVINSNFLSRFQKKNIENLPVSLNSEDTGRFFSI